MPDKIHDIGKLCLIMGDGEEEMECCVGLLTGEDPWNATDMATYATAWGPFLQAVLPAQITITGWRSKNPYGVRATEGAFAPQLVGTHGTQPGVPAYRSLKACITGKTAFPTEEAHAGQTKCFVPLRNSVEVGAQQKLFNADEDPAWEDLAAFLLGQGSLWSDFFGRKAMVRSEVKIHFNSYLQDQRGT